MSRPTFIHSILLLALLPAAILGQTCSGRSHLGQQFTIAFMQQYEHRTDGTLQLQIVADGLGNADISCTDGLLRTGSVSDQVLTVDVSAGMHVPGTGKSGKKCTVTSDVDVAVYVLDTLRDSWLSVDGFLALPDDTLSTDYVIASYQGDSSHDNSGMLVTCAHTCTVTVTLGRQVTSLLYDGHMYSAGQSFREILHKGSLQISSAYDLSGTRVQSNSPVAVYSGSQCAKVPHQFASCDFLTEQMIPTDSWGTRYILPGLFPRSVIIVRVFTAHAQTHLTGHARTHTLNDVLPNAFSFKEYVFNVTEAPVVLQSDKPIMVVEYSPSHLDDNVAGGPAMIVLPSVDQYTSKILSFSDPSSDFLYKTLTMVVKASALPQLSLSGLDGANKHVVPVPPPLSDYVVASFNVTSSVFKVTSPSAPIAAVLHSADSKNREYSYGFPMTMGFPNKGNCVGTAPVTVATAAVTVAPPSPTPTVPTTTRPTPAVPQVTTSSSAGVVTANPTPSTPSRGTVGPFPPTPTPPRPGVNTSIATPPKPPLPVVSTAPTPTQPPVNTATFNPAPGVTTAATPPPIITTAPVVPAGGTRMCFACSDVPHLRYCDTVTTCQAGEVCFVSTTVVRGRTKYRSGCIQQSVCPATATGTPCLSCCNSDFCNSKGCGDTGFAPPMTRGPLCLDCNHVGDVRECDLVTQCAANQLCSFEAYEWGDTDRIYKIGCKGTVECATVGRRSAAALYKRSAPVCQSCCQGDLCNKNCNSSPNPNPVG